jgi:cobalt/nickel transport system permease protein
MRRLADHLGDDGALGHSVRRLPSGLKVAVALGLIALVAAAPKDWAALPWAASAFLLVVAAAARLPLRVFPGRLLLLLPVVIGLGALSLFRADGWAHFSSVATRGAIALSAMLLLSNTTAFTEILRMLRTVKVPALLLTTLALLYRYLFVLVEESDRVRIARTSRVFAGSRRLTWRVLGGVIGELFVRSTIRAERVYAAMVSRGWR